MSLCFPGLTGEAGPLAAWRFLRKVVFTENFCRPLVSSGSVSPWSTGLPPSRRLCKLPLSERWVSASSTALLGVPALRTTKRGFHTDATSYQATVLVATSYLTKVRPELQFNAGSTAATSSFIWHYSTETRLLCCRSLIREERVEFGQVPHRGKLPNHRTFHLIGSHDLLGSPSLPAGG